MASGLSESEVKTSPKTEESAEAAPPDTMAPGGHAYWRLSLALATVWLAIDHLTKWWAIEALKPAWWDLEVLPPGMDPTRPTIPVIPGLLQFVYAENTGAAFSFMTGRTTALGFISLAASVALYLFWKTLPAREVWGRVAVALIFSGAVGNLIDRFFRGYVVDFIDAYYGSYHWPTFNIADSCICVGAAILVVRFLQKKI